MPPPTRWRTPRRTPRTSPELIVVACTGGIGAGKSTVAALLAEKGAVVVDADALARAALEPGTPAYHAVVERFGMEILARVAPEGPDAGPGGAGVAHPPIDRARLAGVVFDDPAALAELEGIVHPVVGAAVEAVLAEHAGTDDVVVLELPLLAGRADSPHHLDAVLVVDAPEDVALHRLVAERGMDPADVRARMAAQPRRSERLARADHVVANVGTRDALAEAVDRAWSWIGTLRPRGARRPSVR